MFDIPLFTNLFIFIDLRNINLKRTGVNWK